MTCLRLLSLFMLAAAFIAAGAPVAPALAYRSDVGVRAANFKGFDIVSRETIELDDYLGRWVYLEFWATWCGPCMRDLPKMVQAVKPYVDSGELSVITVAADREETLHELRRILRDLDFKYPVIYDGGIYDDKFGLPLLCLEWDVHNFPSTFLINPQGVIVANYMWGKDLGKLLDFYLGEDRPVLGIYGYTEVRDEGRSVSICANLMNQERSDLRLRLSSYLTRFIWDEEYMLVDEKDLAITPVSEIVMVSFGEFSETTYEFVIETDEPWHSLTYALFLTVPGAEDIVEREDRGYELLFNGDQILQIEMDRVDGKWMVHP